MPLDPRSYKVITFDCYGTLVDWESGILASVAPVLERCGLEKSEAEILTAYARLESEAEKGPYISYAEVLRRVARGMGEEWGLSLTTAEQGFLVEGFHGWEPFADTVEALRRLHGRYRLAIISNVDDEMFAVTARKLKVSFDWVTTAAQAGAYKPDPAVFRRALERMRVESPRVLHAAQSVYHDVAPAGRLGLATVWVRRASRAGTFGVSPPAEGSPDAEVADLDGLASLLGLD